MSEEKENLNLNNVLQNRHRYTHVLPSRDMG